MQGILNRERVFGAEIPVTHRQFLKFFVKCTIWGLGQTVPDLSLPGRTGIQEPEEGNFLPGNGAISILDHLLYTTQKTPTWHMCK